MAALHLAPAADDAPQFHLLTAVERFFIVAHVGVHRADEINVDGSLKYTGEGNDRDPILQNIGGVVPTNVRAEQMP